MRARTLEEACEQVLTLQAAPAPPTTIYPMPYLDARRALEALLRNPLLLAWRPRRLAATAQAYAAGAYDLAKVRSVACWLLAQRDRRNNLLASEPDDDAARYELLDLCDSAHLRGERTGLRRRVLLARPSEYPWLRGLIGGAIVARAEAAEAALLATT